MRTPHSLCCAALAFLPEVILGQGFAVLDVNNIHARFHADGMIGLSPGIGQPNFEVPAGSGVHALFAAHLWMGGYDAGNQLRGAAVRFGQVGSDWFPGPLTTDGSASITPTVSAQYDRVWKVTSADVGLYQAYCACVNDPGCDEAVVYPGYQIPQDFTDWPAHGDVQAGQAYVLAPFLDANGDGAYALSDCDAPCSPGDGALYFIFNEKLAPHTESGCLPVGVEVQTTAFAYSGPDAALANTVFVQYRIINRGTLTLSDFHLGLFTDLDLGCADDDYLGCDVGRSLWYVYNGDALDEPCNGHLGYGPQPPAFGVSVLCGLHCDPDGTDHVQDSALVAFNGFGSGDGIIDNERHGLGHFMRFENSGGATGDPTTCAEYHNLMRGFWRDGLPLTYGGNGYGGTIPARFVYPGDSDPLGLGTDGVPQPAWNEVTAGNAPFDRRGMGSMGPITLQPGAVHRIVLAFIHAGASPGGLFSSAEALQARVDSIRAFASVNGFCDGLATDVPCLASTVGLAEAPPVQHDLELFPVPAGSMVELRASPELIGARLTIHDAFGRIAQEQRVTSGSERIGIGSLAAGVYTCVVTTPRARHTGRFVKQ
ncbi:MAG: T9SS type A sorting domain-containing protein [Flavobacteriales bacterium]|nr:T9SS type A sorting domain-containing protein [Flavobacteriales bacterium]